MTKKLVALVMALMMLLSVTALAETADTSDWETDNFEDAQLTISCPADMAVVELTDEQTEAGICFATAAADGSLSMAVYSFDPEGATLADAQAEMETTEGYQCAANQVNGIDVVGYDPATDKNLYETYDAKHLEGKAVNKAKLQERLGLAVDPDVPLIGMVTRLVSHKGLDLVCETLDAFMSKDVQFVVLGKGDAKYETFFEYAKQRYGGRMAVYLGYSEQLAMQIYAGADLFLMPSKSEPCGLSQMIAMRYGAVPIVRETGGLKDTVHAYEAWNGQGNGFTFANYNAGDMCHVICEAIDLYHDNKGAYAMLQQRGMTADFSWTRSAQEYRNIYESICR